MATASGASPRTAATTRPTSSPAGQGVERPKHPDRRVLRRSGDLTDLDRAVGRERDQVGERSPHIHPDPHHSPAPTPVRNAECGMRNAELSAHGSCTRGGPEDRTLRDTFRIPHSAFRILRRLASNPAPPTLRRTPTSPAPPVSPPNLPVARTAG